MTPDLPHRGVALGLQDLGERMLIADDGPHVAFVVGVLPDGRPTMWVACSTGRADSIEMYRTREDMESDPSGGSPAPWTYADLAVAGHYLDGMRMHARVQDLPTAHTSTLAIVERMRDIEIDRVLAKAAHESAHPHVCECGRRFASARGLATHTRSCRGVRRYRSSLGPLGERDGDG